MYYPLTQMRKPRLQVITCPGSHAQKKQSWDPLPKLHSKAHSLTPIHLAHPIPGAGAKGKANNVLALGSRGPRGHRRTGGIWPGCGKEPGQVLAGSSLPAHQPHRRVSSPGWSWLPFLDPPNNTGLGPQRVQSPAKRLPANTPIPLSHSITNLGHRHSPSSGGCHPGPGPSQQATPCPGQDLAQNPRVRGAGGKGMQDCRKVRDKAQPLQRGAWWEKRCSNVHQETKVRRRE